MSPASRCADSKDMKPLSETFANLVETSVQSFDRPARGWQVDTLEEL
jgi:hypothetical protein